MSRTTLLVLLGLVLIVIAILARPRPRPVAPPAEGGEEPQGLNAQPMWELRGEDANGKRYLARSRVGGPVEVECTLAEMDNAQSDPRLPRRVVLPAYGEREITVVSGIDPTHTARAAIRCEGVPGDPRARPDMQAAYTLPFYPNTKYTLEQGYDGPFSHHDPESRYAVDLGVEEGTPVLAARDGTVMQTEEEFRGRGMDLERFGARANYVRIVHADGSMAVYAHLAPHSTIVGIGEKVHAGDLIGKSGNTGYSTGPHLHFAVQVNAGMTLRSMRFRMPGVTPDGAAGR